MRVAHVPFWPQQAWRSSHLHGTSADCKTSPYLAAHRFNLPIRDINTRFTISGMEVGIAAIGNNLLDKREFELIQGLADIQPISCE